PQEPAARGGRDPREARRPAVGHRGLQSLRSGEEGDPDALGELARLYQGLGQVPELVEVLSERARFSSDARERATIWARVGELRRGSLDGPDGAAEAYKEAVEGAPDDPAILAALEAIEERRQDFATLQEVLMRRLGSTTGADQIAVLLKLAKNAEQKLSDLE